MDNPKYNAIYMVLYSTLIFFIVSMALEFGSVIFSAQEYIQPIISSKWQILVYSIVGGVYFSFVEKGKMNKNIGDTIGDFILHFVVFSLVNIFYQFIAALIAILFGLGANFIWSFEVGFYIPYIIILLIYTMAFFI